LSTPTKSNTSTGRSWRLDHPTALLTALAIADALGLLLAGMAIGAAAASNNINWGTLAVVLGLFTAFGLVVLVRLIADATEDHRGFGRQHQVVSVVPRLV